jgi:hypothetical protein
MFEKTSQKDFQKISGFHDRIGKEPTVQGRFFNTSL